jgi:outer membrane protein OmpA-like peptidoglycan-associated protein
VTLSGSGFGAEQDDSVVLIGGIPAGINSWTDTKIEAFVPNVVAGATQVVVRRGRVTSAPQPFTVTAPPAQAPFATAIAVPVQGPTVLFDATLSIDPDGTLGAPSRRSGGKVDFQLSSGLNVTWNFGDGTTSKNAVTTHTYRSPGDYSVKLTVTDRSNRSSTVTQRVRVFRPTGFVTRGGRRVPVGPPARVVPVNISLPSQVVFDVGSATLRRESRAFLLRVARVVRRATRVTRVAGYTDSTGSTAFNQELSTQRARAVRAFLVRSARIRANRLRAVGFGERFPLATNNTELGRQKNRRVVLTVRLPVGVRRF